MTPQQLRASLLQQALSGRLTEQRPEDGAADTLYEAIQQEKARLIAEKKIKKEKPLPPIAEEEIPFDIPDTWKWVRLPEIAVSELGKTINKTKDEGTEQPYLCSINVTWAGIKLDLVKTTKLTEKEMEKYLLQKGDMLVCEGGDIGRTAIWENDAPMYYQNALHRIRFFANLSPYFFRAMMEYYKATGWLDKVSKGVTIKHLVQASLNTLAFPLPPLAEQKRIVAKLETLLPLVDQYGDAAARLADYEARFPDDLRKSLLQEAITGRLVPQRAEDGTADALYEAIQKEKARLIAEKKIKKEKPLPPITEEDIPFDIPDTWKWVRFGDISTYGQPKEKISPSAITGDMWSLDLEDIEKDTGKILFTRKASERKITGERLIFHKGQVLYCKLRPYLKKILLAPADGITSPEMVPVWLYAHVNPKFVVYFLKSPNTDFCINSVTYGVKMPRVGTDTMLNLLMPLPPIAEQKRIVAKLEELLPLAERIRSAR